MVIVSPPEDSGWLLLYRRDAGITNPRRRPPARRAYLTREGRPLPSARLWIMVMRSRPARCRASIRGWGNADCRAATDWRLRTAGRAATGSPLPSIAIGLLAIVLGLFAAHFHSAVRDDAPRARLIEKLTAKRGRDLYHDYLRGALGWLDRTIDPPPLARGNPHGRRVLGMKSLGVCISLSLAYSFASFLAGWVAGAQGVLGQVIFTPDPYWAPAVWPSGCRA